MQGFRSNVIRSDDELDHLGLYLKHNHFTTYAQEIHGDSDARIRFVGYRASIDKFFSERMLDPTTPCPLKQEIPPRILEIVEFLSRSNKPGRAEIAAFLLDIDAVRRTPVARNIDEELLRQPTTKRPMPFSMHAGVNLTVFCWTNASAQRRAPLALYHTRTVFLIHEESRRLLLELSYTDSGVLKDIDWNWVDSASIPSRMSCQACAPTQTGCVAKGSPRRRAQRGK